MARRPKHRFALFLMVFAVTTFIVAVTGLLNKQEPFYSWFYCFAWWSYIVFTQALLHCRRGRALLFDAPREFFLLLPLSLTLWLIFEVFNFRLQNWHYLNVPSPLAIRWFGYVLAFSTVLPGIFTTLHFLDHIGRSKAQYGHHSPSLRRFVQGFSGAWLGVSYPPVGLATILFPPDLGCIYFSSGTGQSQTGSSLPFVRPELSFRPTLLLIAHCRRLLRLSLGTMELLGRRQMDLHYSLPRLAQDFRNAAARLSGFSSLRGGMLCYDHLLSSVSGRNSQEGQSPAPSA